MKKIAMLLVVSLSLQLIAPMQVQGAEWSYGNNLAEASENENSQNEIFIEEQSKENETDNEMLGETEISNEEGSEESEASKEEPRESGTAEQEGYRESETSTEEIVMSEAGNESESSTENERVSEEESEAEITQADIEDSLKLDAAISDATEIEGLIQEKYYRCESGYQLFIGASMPEWNESITELTNVAYQLDSNELTVLGTVTTDNFAYYKSSSSYAGGCLTILINDVSADEGEHSVIIYFTVDGNSYQVSGATEFVDEISSDEGTVWEWSNKTEYISNRAGTSIEMLHASGYTFNQDEIWTQLQLVPTGTNNAIVTSTASGHGSNYVSTSRYSLSYKGEDGLYYNLSSKLIPTEYCIGGSFNDITLINNIDEGYYDMLVFTTEGRRYRKKNAYYASGKPIVYDIGHQYYKCEGEDNLFASDDTGDYVSVFVYGLNLDRNTVPTFYDTNNNEVLARYIEGDSECGYEYGNKWGNFYRLKKFSADLGVDQSTKCHAVVSDNAIYTNGEEYVDANIICYDIFFEEFFEHGQLYDDSPGRLRMYIGDKAECAIGDTLTYTLGKYGSFGNISEYTETAVVKSNGNGKYIEFSEESDIYKNIKNEWTYKVIKDGTDSNISKDRFAKIADIQTDWKLEVPAGGSWEIHAIGEITNTICNGNNASNSAVRLSLDKSNISNLAQYGTVRICIYNADGVACERKLVYFSGEEEGDEPGDEPAESAIVELKDGESAIYVYDVATNSPISGAVVAIESISGTTGSDGIVSLNISNEESKRLITVSASGYNGVKTYQTIRNKNLLRIGMEAVNNRIQILSATATLQDQDYDVLREKLVLGYAESMDDFSNIKEGTLKLKIESNKDNVKYEIFSEDTHFLDNVSLSQNNTESDAGDGSGGGGGGGGGGAFGEDDPMYQCNNSGEFEIAVAIETVKLGNREVAQTAVISTLEPGNRMYVRATDANGFFYIKELNISTTHNYLTQENTKQKGSFKLGDELRVSLPEDIPLIGGNEYVFGFGDEMPIEVEIDEDGLVKVAYNKPADIDMDKFNKYYKDLDKKADKVAKFSNVAGVKKFKAGMIDVQGKVCGYGEGNISELKQGTITIKVGVIAEIEGSAGYKQYWVIGFIPVNLYVEGSVKGSVGVESKLKIENWEIKDFELINGSFNVKVKLEAGAGVGFGYEIDASVIGELSYVNKPKRRYQKLWLDCYGKVKRTILGHFEKTLWESSKYEYTLFESGKDDRDAKSSGMDIQESDNGYVVSSRNYLNYTDGYNKTAQTDLLMLNSAETSERENKVIKVAVLPSASPRLVDVDGVKYLFWIDDVTSRDDYNRAALMYTKSADGIVWNMPRRLISETEDSTLDGSYDVYVQDKKIYIVWQDESRQILKEDSLTDILKALSVRYVIFDTTQDSVVENKRITNETGYYMYPCTVAAGDEHYWAYVHNMLDSGDVDGNNTHHLYCLSAKNNDTKEVDLPDKSQIVNMDAGIFSGDPYLVCELDMDGSINTVSDREIYLYNIKNSELSRLTNNNDIDTMPVISDSEKIYWFRNNDLVCLEDEGKTEKNIWNEQQLSYQTVFSVATDSSGRDTIIWEACDSQSEDGSVTIFQTSENDDGSWGNVVRFAKTTGTIASRVSAAGSGENLQVAHTEGIFLQDGTALKDLCVTKRENVVDIAVIGVDFDEESAYAGNQLTLKTEVVNNGNNVVDTIDVSVNDTVIATLTGLNLKPAECRKLDITGFRVLDDIRKSTYYTLKLTTQGETNQENNTADFLLGCPDIYVETNCRISEGRTWLDINLLNNTMYETSGKVLVHKSAENGEVIFSKDYDALGADNGYAYSVDLGDYESEEVKYYVEVTSANEENSLGNNIQFVYIGYGTGIEAEDDSQDIQEINSISLDKESLSLAIGKTAKLSVMDDKGTIVENSSVLWHSSDRCIASIDENGVVKAYRAGQTVISVYYGELCGSCTVTVEGESDQQTLTVWFDTQGGDEISPITGIIPGSTINLPENVTKLGYVFAGWYMQPSGGEIIKGNTIIVTETITLYAHWREDEEPVDTENKGDGLWISGIDKNGYTYTGEAIKPVVRVYDKNTLLKEKTDYTISYKNNTKVGEATITVTGKGNYSGKDTATFKILPVDISGDDVYAMDFYVKISKKAQKPVPGLYYLGMKLKNKKDFTVEYSNASGVYSQAGEYSVTVTGIGNYTGTRVLKLNAVDKIVKKTPVNISKATVSGFEKTFDYTGKSCKQDCSLSIKTTEGEKNLIEGMDYTVIYANNIKAGTATVTFYGKNGYTGKLRKTYKIKAYDINKNQDDKIKFDYGFENAYAKGGSQPKPTITFDGKILKEGTDYTISYKNNSAALGNATPYIVVTGKGNFSGKHLLPFTIVPQDLSKMTLVSGDRTYKSKANIYKITPKLMDLNGKVLSAGKDFDKKSIRYNYANDVVLENGITKQAGFPVDDADVIPAGTEICVTIFSGSGHNYSGIFYGTYRIVKADISSAKATIPKQIYTGNEITLDKSQITVKLSGITLKPEDFEIIRYDNNIKKGNAYVTIKGIGNYGGIKKIKFSIGSKGFLWWWK